MGVGCCQRGCGRFGVALKGGVGVIFERFDWDGVAQWSRRWEVGSDTSFEKGFLELFDFFAPGFNNFNNNNNLAGYMRPLNFASTSSKTSDSKKSATPQQPQHTPQQALLASLVSQTFMQKITSSFWDAFSSPSSHPSGSEAGPSGSNGKKDWDIEKVRKVIEGKAVLRVVDVPSPSKPTDSGVEALEQSLKDLAISSHCSSKNNLGSGSSKQSLSPPSKEKMLLRPEPCFLTGLRNGTSPLSSKKVIVKQENH